MKWFWKIIARHRYYRLLDANDDLDCGQSLTEFIRPSAMRLRKSFEHALKRSGFDGGTE